MPNRACAAKWTAMRRWQRRRIGPKLSLAVDRHKNEQCSVAPRQVPVADPRGQDFPDSVVCRRRKNLCQPINDDCAERFGKIIVMVKMRKKPKKLSLY